MLFTDCSGETIWEIAGHQGENLFKVDGVSRRKAWDNAVLAAVLVTVSEGTTFSARRGPGRNLCVSAKWSQPLFRQSFFRDLT